MFTRKDAMTLTKTMFGLATGRIRHERGEAITAANGLLAFKTLPIAVSEGHFGHPAGDYTERRDFQLLFGHDNDEHPLDYIARLTAEEVNRLADSAETLFMCLISDDNIIPMDSSKKTAIFNALALTD